MPVTNAASGVKAGTVMHFAASTAPAGWLKANGAAVSRTLYAALFAAIGTTYGVGDGATTFNLPDARGEFIRGLDDGRGVDTGRIIGSAQAQDIQAHNHPQQHAGTTATGGTSWPSQNYSGGGNPSATGGAVTGNSTGAETRPRNVAMLACIKF